MTKKNFGVENFIDKTAKCSYKVLNIVSSGSFHTPYIEVLEISEGGGHGE
jgi:hypothetical protein